MPQAMWDVREIRLQLETRNQFERARAARWRTVTTERLELELHIRLPELRARLQADTTAAAGWRESRAARRRLHQFNRDYARPRTRSVQTELAEDWLQLTPYDLS